MSSIALCLTQCDQTACAYVHWAPEHFVIQFIDGPFWPASKQDGLCRRPVAKGQAKHRRQPWCFDGCSRQAGIQWPEDRDSLVMRARIAARAPRAALSVWRSCAVALSRALGAPGWPHAQSYQLLREAVLSDGSAAIWESSYCSSGLALCLNLSLSFSRSRSRGFICQPSTRREMQAMLRRLQVCPGSLQVFCLS